MMKPFIHYSKFLTILLISMLFFSCEDEDEVRPDSLNVAVANDFDTMFGVTVELDGSRTSDASGAPITYSWEAVSFPGDHFAPASLEDANSPIAKFTPLQVGEFVFRLTASTEFESQSANLMVRVDAEIVEVGGVLSGVTETWGRTTPEGMPDYRITSVVSMRESQITVLPGVEIEMTEGVGINVEANSFFNLEGTEEEPIIIQGRENTKGYWGSIRWVSGSSENRMIHVHVSDGGRNRNNDRGMITFGNNGRLHMENCKLSNAANAGLELGIVTSRSNLNLTHIANDYKENVRPVLAKADYYHFFDSESDYTGNEQDIIDSRSSFTSTPSGDLVWQKLNVPYVSGGFGVDADLVIEAGAIIKVEGGNDLIRVVNGTLKVEGTEDDPVIFEGMESGAGAWQGIYVTSSGGNSISHAVIRDTGSSPLTTGASRAAVFVRSGTLSIDNILFADGLGYAYGTWGGAPLITVGENIRLENMALGETNMQED
ncbi:hypothetical protein A33Q_3576 [Indibacter alkaliphilus LW1]|uniref:Right handed beta helix region n=1 Tax=Indibacter alkaliphilus (strain CCUG 57479 / KCTC 22604 / LW1) TaxID=1189612 RepID=S2D9G8_INDAL|nr:hypothetical protein [Indibacter alkaliphilus]EOZ93630.1 hypothetical protein A33Q_3576 [Indibacter alkaliphilus LW1]